MSDRAVPRPLTPKACRARSIRSIVNRCAEALTVPHEHDDFPNAQAVVDRVGPKNATETLTLTGDTKVDVRLGTRHHSMIQYTRT